MRRSWIIASYLFGTIQNANANIFLQNGLPNLSTTVAQQSKTNNIYIQRMHIRNDLVTDINMLQTKMAAASLPEALDPLRSDVVGNSLGDGFGDGRGGIRVRMDAVDGVRTRRSHETSWLVRARLHGGAAGAVEGAPDVDNTIRAGVLCDLTLQHWEDLCVKCR